MSIFENPFKKRAVSPERQEPMPLAPERASAGEAVDPNEPTLAMPERSHSNENLPADAFAQGPGTVDETAERKFGELAQEFNMTSEDLKSLERYETGDGQLFGIRGTINGVPVDLKQVHEPAHGAGASRVIGTMGGREMQGSEVEKEFARLTNAISRRGTRAWLDEGQRDAEVLTRVQGKD